MILSAHGGENTPALRSTRTKSPLRVLAALLHFPTVLGLGSASSTKAVRIPDINPTQAFVVSWVQAAVLVCAAVNHFDDHAVALILGIA
jgi:hypothetical protein